jgi:hypothetical protein
MSTNARWMVGLLLVAVIGLGVALLIVAGDDSDDGGETTVAPETTELSVESTITTETEVPTVTETTTTTTTPDGSGGVPAP